MWNMLGAVDKFLNGLFMKCRTRCRGCERARARTITADHSRFRMCCVVRVRTLFHASGPATRGVYDLLMRAHADEMSRRVRARCHAVQLE
jgi:hypothetical protein